MWLIQRVAERTVQHQTECFAFVGKQKKWKDHCESPGWNMRQDGCWWKASTATANWNLQLNCNLDILDQHSEAESCESKGSYAPNAKMPPLRGNWTILKGDEAHHCVLRIRWYDRANEQRGGIGRLRIIGYYCALVAVAIILPFSVFSATGMQKTGCVFDLSFGMQSWEMKP